LTQFANNVPIDLFGGRRGNGCSSDDEGRFDVPENAPILLIAEPAARAPRNRAATRPRRGSWGAALDLNSWIRYVA
jgi:hypothetical protein